VLEIAPVLSVILPTAGVVVVVYIKVLFLAVLAAGAGLPAVIQVHREVLAVVRKEILEVVEELTVGHLMPGAVVVVQVPLELLWVGVVRDAAAVVFYQRYYNKQ
jgi:hypothetical protein